MNVVSSNAGPAGTLDGRLHVFGHLVDRGIGIVDPAVRRIAAVHDSNALVDGHEAGLET
jgi:hypothetical protein